MKLELKISPSDTACDGVCEGVEVVGEPTDMGEGGEIPGGDGWVDLAGVGDLLNVELDVDGGEIGEIMGKEGTWEPVTPS